MSEHAAGLSGEAVLTLAQMKDGNVRATFLVGQRTVQDLTYEASPEEAVQASVLISVAGNAVLLEIERAALRRAKALLEGRLQAVQTAIEGYGGR